MNEIVRETLDGEDEIFEDLLNRILNDFKDSEISWLQFLGHFSKRGRLQGYNDINISPTKGTLKASLKLGSTIAEQGQGEKDEKEQKQLKLTKQVKQKLDYKQDMVPKEGKGKYNITVPVPYEFL